MGIFRRARAGHDVRNILNHIKDGNLLLQLHLVPESRLRYEFLYNPNMPPNLRQGNGNLYLDSLVYELNLQGKRPEKSRQQSKMESEYLSPYLTPYHAAVPVEPLLSDAITEVPHPTPSMVLECSKMPQQLVAEAKVHFETLIRLYYLRHGFENFNPILVQFLSVFSFSSISNLAQNKNDPEWAEAAYSSIILSAKGFRGQARSCQLSRIISQIVCNTLNPDQTWLWREGIPAERRRPMSCNYYSTSTPSFR